MPADVRLSDPEVVVLTVRVAEVELIVLAADPDIFIALPVPAFEMERTSPDAEE